MNTRIRYKQISPGLYESVQSFLHKDGALVKAWYSVADKTLGIARADGDASGWQDVEQFTSVHAAKLRLKAKLKNYGVNFLDEVRRKKDSS